MAWIVNEGHANRFAGGSFNIFDIAFVIFYIAFAIYPRGRKFLQIAKISSKDL